MPVEDKGGVAGRDPREGEPVECQWVYLGAG